MPTITRPSLRRYDDEEGERKPGRIARLPLKSKVAFSLATLFGLGALSVIVGNANIRAGFLQAQGHTAYGLSFLAIQIGILCAACGISYEHSHPYARRWRRLAARLRSKTVLRDAAVTTFIGLAARCNGLLDRREAMLAMAGKQTEVSRADVPRQQYLGRHWEMLASPEAQEKRMFPKPPVPPTKLEGKALLSYLTGITDLPTFERKDTGHVHARQAALRAELNQLRQERRNLIRRTRMTPAPAPGLPPSTPTTVRVGDEEFATETPDMKTVTSNGKAKRKGGS